LEFAITGSSAHELKRAPS
jgi:hypothetical protein